MKTQELDQTILNVFDALNDRPIVYHGIYSQIMGSTSAGLLASQLIYWSKVMHHQEFYKTDADICEELRMGHKELRNAKKRITESGAFSIVVKGVPPKTFYLLNIEVLVELISKAQATSTSKTGQINLAQRDKLEYPKGTNQFNPKGQIITEMTTEITKEDNNKNPKSVECSMVVAKKRMSHVEPKSIVKPEHQLQPKTEPTQQSQLEPNGSVVVDPEIDDLLRIVKGWAISKVMLETWAKKHGVTYVLKKIELTKSAIALNRVRQPGAYLNKAIKLDWLPPAPDECEEAPNNPAEPIFPTHEENVTWYNSLVDSEKLEALKVATYKNAYLEDYLKNAKISVLNMGFSESTWFKMLMSCLGRAV